MHIHIPGSSVNRGVRSKRCDLRRGRKRHHRPLDNGFPAQIVRNVGPRNLRCFLLCSGKRSENSNTCKCNTTQAQSYFQSHHPSPRSRAPQESLWIASPHVACGSTQMYHCLDDYNTSNGFCCPSFCANRQHLRQTAIARKDHSHRKQTRFINKSFSPKYIRAAKPESPLTANSHSPHPFFRVPQINSSI